MTDRLAPLGLALAGAAFFLTTTHTREAQAGIAACGDIHVQADAQCEMLVDGGCQAQCEPIYLEAACAAELHANCDGQCNASASLDCQAECSAECVGGCVAEPATFDCLVSCNADCQASCDASCSTGDSECRASCEATCSAGCEGSCEVTPPSATCEARCAASCEGSCEAQANLDCQVDCQADGFAMCEADLRGGCEAQCTQPEGALFCDGQYIDHGGNLEACVDALRAELDIEVEGYAEGQCSEGRCTGEAGGSISCSVAESGDSPWWAMLGTFTLIGLVAMRRSAAA